MKKRLITTTICLTIIVGFIVPVFASAQVFPSASEIASSMINYVMGAFVDLSANFARIAGSLLDWVISPEFISFSYTNPAGDNANPIVAVGLDITKNFVNLGLVVVLIFIAISVSLQIGEYGSKKTFIKLIVVAILVNFVPVIAGLVVDAANITMNFFLDGIRNDISGALTDINNESLIGALTRPGTVKPFSLLVRGAVLIGLYTSIGFAFLLMVFIFVFRYITIWLLVILGPLAFVAWILPSTKKLWDMWWKQLFQWSFIGIPMAFFLYLAASAMPIIKGRFESQVVIPGAESSIVGIVDQTFPYFVIVAFIYIGFFIGLKATAFGSSTAIRAAQWSRVRAQSLTWRGTRATAGKIGRGLRPAFDVERRARGKAAAAARGLRGLGNWGMPGARKIKPFAAFKWATPKRLSEFGNLRPVIEAAAKGAENESGMETADKILTQKMKGAQGMGLLLKLLKTNDAQDLFKRAQSFGRWKGLSDEQLIGNKEFSNIIAPLLKSAADTGMLGSTLRRDPRLAKIANKHGIRGYTKNEDGSKMTPERAVSKATSQARSHINDWEPEELNDKDLVRSVLANFEEDRLLQLNRGVKNGQKTMLKSMDEDFSDFTRTKSSFSKLSEAELERRLKGTEERDKDGNKIHKDSADFTKVWEEYGEMVNEKYDGHMGFKALQSKRVLDRGYRKARFTPKEEVPEEKLQRETEALGRIGDKNRNKPTTIWGAFKESRVKSKMKKGAVKKANKKVANKKNDHKPGTIFGKRK